jgi:hypothetical protein
MVSPGRTPVSSVSSACDSLSVTPAVALRANMPQCHWPRQRKSVLARPVESLRHSTSAD